MPTDAMSEGRGDAVPRDRVERQIVEAMADGSWDRLPGAGRPLRDLDEEYRPGWWAERWVQRQRDADEADRLRRLIRAERPRLRAMRDRDAALSRVREINGMVAEVNLRLPEDERVRPIELG